MEINGKVYCMFEQSGTFKNEFIKLGIPAIDLDIQNNFGQTDKITDIFGAIQDAYNGRPSIFDEVSPDDLIMAFFPCIYFCENSQLAMTYNHANYRKMTIHQKSDAIIDRAEKRQHLYVLLIQLFSVIQERNLRMVLENPYSGQHYLLHQNFVMAPTFIDHDRSKRGDYFKKPTQYYFVNCERTYGCTIQKDKERKTISSSKSGIQAGICSEERSMLSPDYARNFICDFIIGRKQVTNEPTLF